MFYDVSPETDFDRSRIAVPMLPTRSRLHHERLSVFTVCLRHSRPQRSYAGNVAAKLA